MRTTETVGVENVPGKKVRKQERETVFKGLPSHLLSMPASEHGFQSKREFLTLVFNLEQRKHCHISPIRARAAILFNKTQAESHWWPWTWEGAWWKEEHVARCSSQPSSHGLPSSFARQANSPYGLQETLVPGRRPGKRITWFTSSAATTDRKTRGDVRAV